MTSYRFKLDTSSQKYTCPNCGQKRFVRYIDAGNGQLLEPKFGRCDREDKCGYHLKPSYNGQGNTHLKAFDKCNPPAQPASYISAELFNKSMNRGADNNFINYLETLFPADVVQRIIDRYHIGTSKHWPGSTIFWQVDKDDRIRAGKVMLYNSETGRRVKQPFNHVTWVHAILKFKPFSLKQCFFGEHLLKQYPAFPVAITESEKSAIIASVYMPGCIWLSTGQKNGLSVDKCRVLAGRKIVLYPDLGAYEDWKAKARGLKKHLKNTSISVIDLLERKASEAEREKGLDIADYLTCFPYIEPFCYEDRKRNPWPGSKYWTMKGSEGFEYIWEIVTKPNGCKTRLIECRKINRNKKINQNVA